VGRKLLEALWHSRSPEAAHAPATVAADYAQNDIFEWHFVIRGPVGTDFEVSACQFGVPIRKVNTPDEEEPVSSLGATRGQHYGLHKSCITKHGHELEPECRL
jgi:hypothetical protein